MNPRNEGSKPTRRSDTQPSAAGEGGKPPGPFDVRTVQSLVALMTQHDLSEIYLRDGIQRLRLRRGAFNPLAMAPTSLSAQPASPIATPAPVQAEPTPPAQAKALVEIKSPTPGTFYVSAKPGDPPFVKVGSKVTPETVVCLIEAMKIFNEIQAEVSGVIVEVVLQNQQPVEYGQVLFRVDPLG